MTEHEMLKREGLAWLVAQIRWEHRLDELRHAAGGFNGTAMDLTTTREADDIAA